jgi:hypothetical protein
MVSIQHENMANCSDGRLFGRYHFSHVLVPLPQKTQEGEFAHNWAAIPTFLLLSLMAHLWECELLQE